MLADQNRVPPAPTQQMQRVPVVIDCPITDANPYFCAELVQALAAISPGKSIRLNPPMRTGDEIAITVNLNEDDAPKLQAQLSWRGLDGAIANSPVYQTNQLHSGTGQAGQTEAANFARQIVQNTPELVRILS